MIPLLLATLWTLLAVLCGTAALAVQEASRTRLTAILKGKGRGGLLEQFFKTQTDCARTATSCQQLWIALFVVTVFIAIKSPGPWFVRPLIVVAICVPWQLLFLSLKLHLTWPFHAVLL